MKIFITTLGILILSFFINEPRISSQRIIIDGRVVSTFSNVEMLARDLVSRIKLAHCQVTMLTIQDEIAQYNNDIVNDSIIAHNLLKSRSWIELQESLNLLNCATDSTTCEDNK